MTQPKADAQASAPAIPAPPEADVEGLAQRVATILRRQGVRYDEVQGRNQALFRAFSHFRSLGLSWEEAVWHAAEIFCLSHDRAKHIVSDLLREERTDETGR